MVTAVDRCLFFLGGAALVVGALAAWSQASGRTKLFYAFKPLAMGFVLAVAIIRRPMSPALATWIIAGLGFSLLGDVLLMLPSDRFVAGLASFLVAQLCYIAAFEQEAGAWGPLWAALPSVALLLLLARYILPKTGGLRLAVAIYGLVIASMAWRATVRYASLGQVRALLGMLGAWLFCASDLSLAWGRFVRRSAWQPIFCLGTYYLAQLLIALSI